jgi:hypothetical protein
VRSVPRKGLKAGGYYYVPNAQPQLPSPVSSLEDSYRLSVKVRDDEKALGLSDCIGAPPRPPIGN